MSDLNLTISVSCLVTYLYGGWGPKDLSNREGNWFGLEPNLTEAASTSRPRRAGLDGTDKYS